MIKTIGRFLGLTIIAVCACATNAGSLTLTPSSETVMAGEELVITIAADFTGEAILGGGFDITYNSNVLEYIGFEFDAFLEDDEAFRRSPDDLENELNGFGFGEFLGLEGQFVIGQVSFIAIANGVTSLDMNINEGGVGPGTLANPGPFVLVDGQILGPDDIQFNSTSVQVVPLPAAAWFLLSGLCSMGLLRRT